MSNWIQRSDRAPVFEARAGGGQRQATALGIGGIYFGTVSCDPNAFNDDGTFLDAPVGSCLIRNDLALGGPPGTGGTGWPCVYVMTNSGDGAPWWAQ